MDPYRRNADINPNAYIPQPNPPLQLSPNIRQDQNETDSGQSPGHPSYQQYRDTPTRTSAPRIPSQYSANNYAYPNVAALLEPPIAVAKKSSVILPQLREEEKEFFEYVSEGDVETVRAFLNQRPNFNINCVNFQGVSALHIAIQNRNEQMLSFLLSLPRIDLGDCVLHAIRDNQPRLAILLLEKLQKTAPGLEYAGCINSSEFPEYITPLILAAQCGHYEIIQMLIERGHTIDTPHPPKCRCKQCLMQIDSEDLLNASAARLNVYRAISNPAYISQSCDDPVLKAFFISHELSSRSNFESEFRAAYMSLADEVSQFAVELLGQCRSTEEVQVLLRQKSGNDSGHGSCFPRLALARDLKQKNFVAHPNCQIVVRDVWIGDFRNWPLHPLPLRVLLLIFRIFLLPFIFLMNIVSPNHNYMRKLSAPVSKYMSHLASYLVFLILIFLESNQDKKNQKRGPPNTGLEPFIILYVVGYIWDSIRMCIIQGPRRYLIGFFALGTLVSLFLFVCTFIFWLLAYFDLKVNDQIDLERKYWHEFDPILIAEGLFTIAVIISYFRLLSLCLLNFTLGPLQISLGKMSADIAKYVIIFSIMLLAFCAGLTRFYQYYSGMSQLDVKTGVRTVQTDSFINFRSTFKTLFWAIFCMSPLESTDVVIENLSGDTEDSTVTNSHGFTQLIGTLIFAAFEIMAVVIILNMLIATMSNTFQRVQENADVEWTFARTSISLNYFLQTNVPPPFNLIPTPTGVKNFLNCVKSGRSCCPYELLADERQEKEFPVLMSLLVQRYFRDHDSSAPQSDLEAIKTEIVELKNMIRLQNAANLTLVDNT